MYVPLGVVVPVLLALDEIRDWET